MKKTLLIILAASDLGGCALWMANYDSNEYSLVNKVRTIAELGNCEDRNMLYATNLELKNFSQYIPRNQASIDLNNNLFVLVEELHKRENPSQAYCKLKLNSIAKSAEAIQKVTGSKPR